MGNLREHDVHSAALLAQLGIVPGAVRYAAKSSGNAYGFLRDDRRIPASRLHTNINDAYDAAFADRNDVVILGPNYDSNLTAELVWNKHHTHLIGQSPTPFQPRNDIKQSGVFSPMITVSSRGCIFKDMTIRHADAATSADLIMMTVSGRYNLFDNVYFMTPYHADQDVVYTNPDSEAGCDGYCGVRVSGHNNYFRNCRFGSDGIVRDQVNFNLEVFGGIGNIFEGCLFACNVGTSSLGPQFVNIANVVGDMRFTLFKKCTFLAYSVSTPAPNYTMFQAINCTVGGNSVQVVLEDCNFVNVTTISNTHDEVWIWKHTAGDTAAAAATGIAIRDHAYD